GLSSSVVMMGLDEVYRGRYPLDQVALWQLAPVLVTLVASHIAFTWTRRPRRARLQLQLQSPVVVTWGDSPRPARRVSLLLQSPVAAARKPAPVPVPVPAMSLAGASTADQPRPRSWLTEARVLAWQTMREGR